MTKSLTRRIIAIMFAVCYIGVISYKALMGEADALIALIATGSAVTAFYLGVKAGQI